MSTVHFVYPRDAERHSSPWCIGNEIGDRLQQHHRVQFYNWRDKLSIHAEEGDVLLGHPHWGSNSVFRRSLDNPRFARRLILQPYVGDPRQVAYLDGLIDRCDLFLAITGGHWFRQVPQSPMARWLPKMQHVDLAVNRAHFPLLKQRFNPPGRRRFVYIGHTARNKNTPYLSALARACNDMDIGWIGRGRKRIPHLNALGFMNFSTEPARAILAEFDFMITVGNNDANPTTILESLSWGLIPVCPPQSGYEGTPGIVNLPLDDVPAAAEVLRRLQQADDTELQALRAAGETQLREHFHWDRAYAQIQAAIMGSDNPPLHPASVGEAFTLWRNNLFH